MYVITEAKDINILIHLDGVFFVFYNLFVCMLQMKYVMYIWRL